MEKVEELLDEVNDVVERVDKRGDGRGGGVEGPGEERNGGSDERLCGGKGGEVEAGNEVVDERRR